MAQKSRADILIDILADFADNTQGLITAELLREILTTLSDSSVNITTDTNLLGGVAEYDTGRIYYSGQIVQYDYKWYVANTTTVAGAFDANDWDFQSYVKYNGSLDIATADVLTLNATPLTLIAAIANKTIIVKSVRAFMTFNTTAYATNTELNVYMNIGGSAESQFTIPTFLEALADQHRLGTVTASAIVAENTAVKIKVNTGDPTAGDSDITIAYEYEIVD